MPRARVEPRFMGTADEAKDPIGPEEADLRAVVPARAVLTELARGFLLVHESNPGRAVRFAETFLREQTGASEPGRAQPSRPVTRARLQWGRLPRGAVDPTNFPPTR